MPAAQRKAAGAGRAQGSGEGTGEDAVAAASASPDSGGSGDDDRRQQPGAQQPAAGQQQHGAAASKASKAAGGKKSSRAASVGAPLLVLLLAILAACAVQQWPPDSLIARVQGGLRGLSGAAGTQPAAPSSSSSGGGGSSSSSSSGSSSGSSLPSPQAASDTRSDTGGPVVLDGEEWVAADARGFFPQGCKWRELVRKGANSTFWGVRRYQYWDAAAADWSNEQPPACVVRGQQLAAGGTGERRAWRNGSPRTAARCEETHCVYDNLWFNNGNWYLLVDGPDGVEPWKLSRNQQLHTLHVRNASAFADSAKVAVVGGDTLVFDFVFFLHPTAIGHWSEMLFPLFSILRKERSFARPPTQMVLLHLKRAHMMEWVRATLATALGVGPRRNLPPIMWQEEVPEIMDQLTAGLEGYPPDVWVAFDRVLVVKDVYTGGVRTFLGERDAHLYRKMLYAQYNLPQPKLRSPLPRAITFLRKSSNRRVVNEPDLLAMLAEFGQVRVVEFDASTPFKEQLETMASTTVLVSVHTSALANAQFMQPGSAVFEIIQRNWFWHGLDRSFEVQTATMGDIHHYAWRATRANETEYIVARDRDRFGDWEPLQCDTDECVEAHTNVDVRVDIPALRALLADRLPLVWKRWPVGAAAVPWPAQEGAEDEDEEGMERGPPPTEGEEEPDEYA